MQGIEELSKLKIIKIQVKPNSKKTELLGYDENKKAYILSVNAPADKNKANLEVIKFFTKLLKKKVRIKTGMKSKDKLLEVINL